MLDSHMVYAHGAARGPDLHQQVIKAQKEKKEKRMAHQTQQPPNSKTNGACCTSISWYSPYSRKKRPFHVRYSWYRRRPLSKCQCTTYKRTSGRLTTLWQRSQTSEITTSHFLKAVGNLYAPTFPTPRTDSNSD
ncbi:uncharacterized protein LOC125652421 [Ostrea edulis]|uniref:uncharacterized protein LOC125652421 n=1 Tax=Ostrea edulis TaxID=37623 RepID=UPI0024AFEF7D|nr:uncharacterized protein LOC125652421 [Ostrea edulis]